LIKWERQLLASVAIENGFSDFIATYVPRHHAEKTQWRLIFLSYEQNWAKSRVLWHSCVQDQDSS